MLWYFDQAEGVLEKLSVKQECYICVYVPTCMGMPTWPFENIKLVDFGSSLSNKLPTDILF